MSAKEAALKKLSRRGYHSHELKKKLLEMGCEEGDSDAAIAECRRLGYLDDRSWLEAFIHHERRASKGPKGIAMKLRQKGINDPHLDELLSAHYGEEEVRQEVERVLTKRYGGDLADPKLRQRAVAGLLRRGFTWDQIAIHLN